MVAKAVGVYRLRGLRDLQRDLRALDKDLPKKLRAASKAAGSVVAVRARELVPVDSGALKKTVKVRAEQRGAAVAAGSKVRVPYAYVNHWGWPSPRAGQGGSNPKNPFISKALADRHDEMVEVYRKAIDELKDEVGL